MCLVEGRMWDITAYMKLLDEDMNPFVCDKAAAIGEPLACPSLVVEINQRHGFHQLTPINQEEGDWITDDWNKFSATVTVTHELADAETVFFKFKGPAPGISIVLDGVSTDYFSTFDGDVDCKQLIKATNAMSGVTDGWLENGGGEIAIVPGGYELNPQAFAYIGRESIHSGPGQMLDTKCITKGLMYDFNAKFRLRDDQDEFIACDKNAEWKHQDYCLLMTLIMQMPGDEGEIRKHYVSEYGGPWVKTQFNPFKVSILVNEEMERAKEILLVFRGPSPDIDIIFDSISMKIVDNPFGL